jgi:hypothetical protein
MSFIRFVKKPNLKNVSNMNTPAILATLLLISIIFIYTIELIGLSNRQRNIELRQSIIDSNVLTKVSKLKTQDITEEKITRIITPSKENNVETMNKILLDAVIDQMETTVLEDDYVFYDF